MSYDLKMGFVGTKESYIAKAFILDEYVENDRDTHLYLEKKHNGSVRGQYFDDIEDLLPDELSIKAFKNLDDYIGWEMEMGTLDNYLSDNDIDEDTLSDNDKKNIIIESADSDLIEKLSELKEGEELYFLDGYEGNIYDLSKGDLILASIADGQYVKIFENTQDIIDSIENKDDITTVFVYNNMGNYNKEKYSSEYDKIESYSKIIETISKIKDNLYINLDDGEIVGLIDFEENKSKTYPSNIMSKTELLSNIEDLENKENKSFYFHYFTDLEMAVDYIESSVEVFKEHPSDVIDGVMGEIEKSDKKVEQKLNQK
jgi:hypothetical protein